MSELKKSNTPTSSPSDLYKQYFAVQPHAAVQAAAPTAAFEIFSLTKTNVSLVYSNGCQK